MDNGAPFPHDNPSAFLAAIVESSADAIIGKDLDGTIVSWNLGAELMYGYTGDEVKGRSIAVLIPEEREDDLAHVMARIRSGQRVAQYETVRRTKDGRLLDVSLTVSPVFSTAGRIVGAATIARDITLRKEAERALRVSELQWRSVIEAAVDGIVVIDARGKIEGFNPAAERLFGYTEAEVLGRNVSLLMPSPYHDEHDDYLARYIATGQAKIIGIGREVTGLRRDGSTFPIHLSVGEMLFGGERKFTGILHDLSARVRIEEQLRERTALARLGEMAAVVAHEVKNPLAGVRGAIQVVGGRLPPGSKDALMVKEIIKRIDGLNDLMKDLLLFARPPQLHVAPVDIAALVTTTATLFRDDPLAARVSVTIDGSAPAIMADPELLKIVFVNLLVNGAHAMQGEGGITVSITPIDDMCHVAVRDRGPGIPVEIRDKIFTPFFTTKSRGSGLGLPTAKSLIEAHGGRIDIDCPPDGGTIVNVRLPLPG
jgi:two-component system sensor kinase FixL